MLAYKYCPLWLMGPKNPLNRLSSSHLTMDAFDTLKLTSGQLEVHDISTPPSDLPVDRQTEIQPCVPCIIA